MEEAIVVSRLIRWAKWKLGSGKHLGFKPQVSFVRLAGEESVCPDYDNDRECIETNNAFEQLPELHKLLIRTEYLIPILDINKNNYIDNMINLQYVI